MLYRCPSLMGMASIGWAVADDAHVQSQIGRFDSPIAQIDSKHCIWTLDLPPDLKNKTCLMMIAVRQKLVINTSNERWRDDNPFGVCSVRCFIKTDHYDRSSSVEVLAGKQGIFLVDCSGLLWRKDAAADYGLIGKIIVERRKRNQFIDHIDASRWIFPSVFDGKSHVQRSNAWRTHFQRANDFRQTVKVYPRSLIGIHQVQLFFHQTGSCLHLRQLPSGEARLPSGYARVSDDGNYASQSDPEHCWITGPAALSSGIILLWWGWRRLWERGGWRPDDRRNISFGLPLCGFGACLIVWGLIHVLAAADGRSENIGVHPIVVPELKFRDVQRHIFGTDFVEATYDAALEDRPEAFNRVDNVVSLYPSRVDFAAVRRRAKGATRLAPAKPSPGVHHRLLILECSGSGAPCRFLP
jgi:hypothetical protein